MGKFYLIIFCLLTCLLTGCLSKTDQFEFVGNGIPLPSISVANRTYKITSAPLGADIYFRGDPIGKTPLTWKRYVLIPTLETTEFVAKLKDHEDGVLAGKVLSLTSQTTKQKNGIASNWSAFTTELHFTLPLHYEVALKNDWDKAKEIHSEEGYSSFLNQYSSSKYSDQARQLIAQINHDEAQRETVACEKKTRSYRDNHISEQELVECCKEFVNACSPQCNYTIRLTKYSSDVIVMDLICRNRDIALFIEAPKIATFSASGLYGLLEGTGFRPKRFEVRVISRESKLVGTAHYSNIRGRIKWVSGFR